MQVERRTDQIVRDTIRVVRMQVIGMWRYRWFSMAALWIVCLFGWGSVYLMQDVYSASARVFVDTENAIDYLLGGIAAPTDVTSEVSLVVREIVSRPNLAEVAKNTGLEHRASDDGELQELLTSLRNRISVVGNMEGEYSISFEDTDRDMAVAVVDNLVTTFVTKSLGADRTDSEQAQQFLQRQIDEYEQRLTAAENSLADFKRENVAFMPDQRGDYFSRFQAAETTLQATEAKIDLAEQRRAELLRQIEGEDPVFGIVAPSTASDSSAGTRSTSAKIRDLEFQLEELRLQYTDKHPRVGQIKDTIEMLKRREEEQIAAWRQAALERPLEQNPLDLNPVYQSMRIQLSNVDVELASLRTERDQQRRELVRLKDLVDTVPQVEAQLNRLNRDYDVVKAKHQQFLQQLEMASIGEKVSRSIDDIQILIIDPPYSDLEPVGPNRPVLLIAVLAAALAASIGIAFVLNQFNPTFIGQRSVTEILGIPVLASVSLLQSRLEIWEERRERYALQAAALMLFVSAAAAVVFSRPGSLLLRNLVAGSVG